MICAGACGTADRASAMAGRTLDDGSSRSSVSAASAAQRSSKGKFLVDEGAGQGGSGRGPLRDARRADPFQEM